MSNINVKKNLLSITSYLPVLLLVVALSVFVAFSDTFLGSNIEQEQEVLEKALDRSITQCYALEGTYPSSINYLKEHYGLTYNEEHFFIDYQYIGGNLRPDVTIIERK